MIPFVDIGLQNLLYQTTINIFGRNKKKYQKTNKYKGYQTLKLNILI